MTILAIEFSLYLPHVQSLKEKRSEIKRLMAKLQSQFHLSIAEISHQDMHQTAVLGAAAVVAHTGIGDRLSEQIIRAVEANCSGELTQIVREYR